jgi:hypothetical protein
LDIHQAPALPPPHLLQEPLHALAASVGALPPYCKHRLYHIHLGTQCGGGEASGSCLKVTGQRCRLRARARGALPAQPTPRAQLRAAAQAAAPW